MKISLKIQDGRIADARFKTFGCGSAIASSSMATELIKGRTIDEAMNFTNQEVVDALGGLPPVKIHCSVLAEEALSLVIRELGVERPVLALQPQRPVNPASLTKLLTTYAALERLGPAWSWTTPVWLHGPISDGVLEDPRQCDFSLNRVPACSGDVAGPM